MEKKKGGGKPSQREFLEKLQQIVIENWPVPGGGGRQTIPLLLGGEGNWISPLKTQLLASLRGEKKKRRVGNKQFSEKCLVKKNLKQGKKKISSNRPRFQISRPRGRPFQITKKRKGTENLPTAEAHRRIGLAENFLQQGKRKTDCAMYKARQRKRVRRNWKGGEKGAVPKVLRNNRAEMRWPSVGVEGGRGPRSVYVEKSRE